MDESNSILWSPTTNMNVVDPWEALNPKRKPQNELDKDAFLKLLMTQLQNQDPLNPMEDQEFLGQMAQFTQLEQMVNLNSAYSKTQAYSMLGKQVEGVYTDPATEATTETSGTVVAVTTKGSEVYLTLDNNLEVPMSSVTAVGDEYLTNAMLDSIASDVYNTRAQALVGKRIQAITVEDGKLTDYIEGIVDYIKFNGTESVLVVNGKEVLPHEVASVADAASDNPFLVGREINVSVPGDGGAARHTGVITGVRILSEKAIMQVQTENNGVMDVPIEKINYVSEALGYVGENIDHGTFEGRVTGVVINSGVPYFQILQDGEVRELSYKTFIEEKE